MTYDHKYCTECKHSPCTCDDITEMIKWSNDMEFVKKWMGADKYAMCKEITMPPWYVIHLSGGYWDSVGWYWWHQYQGPPVVYLTRRAADKKADQLRNQYKSANIRVLPMIPGGLHDGEPIEESELKREGKIQKV